VSAVELAAVAGAVLLASLVQVVAGFGFGLLAVPLMTLAISPRDAVVVATLVGVCVNSWQTWHGRRDLERSIARRMTAAAYLGMPIGLWVFLAVDERLLQLLLGAAVVVAVCLLAARIDLHHVGPGLDLAAGFTSGILNTSVSTNGPPLVFALQARRLDPSRFRATISRVFTWSSFGALALFVGAGRVDRGGLAATGAALPAMVAGQLAGFPLRRHLHGDRFRVLVLALLALAGAAAVLGALA